MAITQSVVDAVLAKTGERPVTTVRVSVGRLSGFVPDAMRFCFELATAGTPLEGATLEIDEPLGRARCRACGAEFTVPDLLLQCACGSMDAELLAGRELRVRSVEVV
jgi:hydrogenase nickel incorporation protein HypA/HybF